MRECGAVASLMELGPALCRARLAPSPATSSSI